MQTFGITELSIFCDQIESIMDICRIYQISIKDPSFIEIVQNETRKKNVANDEDLIQGLANLAMEIDSPSGANAEEITECVPHDIFHNNIYDENEQSQLKVHFDVESFYRFIRYDINDENVGKMLQLMQDSMSATLEKKDSGQHHKPSKSKITQSKVVQSNKTDY